MFELKVFKESFPDTDFLTFNYGENIELINITIPKGAYCGIYIFLQDIQATSEQLAFMNRLRKNNYSSCICKSLDNLLDCVKTYLTGSDWSAFQKDLNEYISSKYCKTKSNIEL